MSKNFSNWILKKEELHNRKNTPNFSTRYVYWCGIGENIGDEENGKSEYFSRPVLILKKFKHRLFWGVPLTTVNKNNPYYIAIKFHNINQSAMITHLRLMDSKRLYVK
jgi:mRNA interferase MazF